MNSQMELKKFSPDYIDELRSWFDHDNAGNEFIRFYAQPEQWLRLVDNAQRFGYAAVVDKKMVGFVDVELNERHEASFALGISPEVRGQGFGKQLVALTESFAKSRHATSLYAGVEEANTACRQLLKSRGFREVPESDGMVGYSKPL